MYFQIPGEVNKEVALPAIKTVETIKSVSYYLIVYNICLVVFPFSHLLIFIYVSLGGTADWGYRCIQRRSLKTQKSWIRM